MKSKILIAILATIVATCTVYNSSFAQFTVVPFSLGQYYEANPTLSGLGLGSTFSLTSPPQSAFHINTKHLVFPAFFTPGEVFRTDCPALNSTTDTVNAWRMLTDSLEIGGLFNYYNATLPNDLTVKASAGNMIFNTTAFEHFRITAGNVPTQANPGLGAIIRTDNLNYFQISNLAANTGYGAFDPYTVLRVIGDSANDGATDIIPVAEFRRNDSTGQETAIKIRGQRYMLTTSNNPPANTASILFSNWDNDEPTGVGHGVDYIMSKIASGMQRSSGQTGNISFYTNQGQGITPNIGLRERARINSIGYFGINLTTPSNRLEIHVNDTTIFLAPPVTLPHNVNSPSLFSFCNTPNTLGGTGWSGLRFTDMRAISIPDTFNPGPGVLALDTNGDVIYVPYNAAFGLCSNIPSLSSNSGIDLAGQNLFFAGNNASSSVNNVIIGQNCINPPPFAKLNVLQNSIDEGTWGIYCRNMDPGKLVFTSWHRWSVAVVGNADGAITPFAERENVGGIFIG